MRDQPDRDGNRNRDRVDDDRPSESDQNRGRNRDRDRDRNTSPNPDERPETEAEAESDADTDSDSSSDEEANAGSDPDGGPADDESTDRTSEPSDDSSETARRRDAGSDDPRPPEGTGSDRWLTTLLEALEAVDELSTSGRKRFGGSMFDYDVSIRSGTDVPDRDRDGDRAFPLDPNPFAGDSIDRSERPRTKRHRQPLNAYHGTTRTRDDELVVVADVAGLDPDEITVGFDDAALVIGVEDREIDRIDVPWPERTAEARVKNGVLTVTVREEGSK
ncbi:Hsp20/alpha crystallin family protein [Natrialbaceae archaeon GCM10025810]|uniref:Hsp20/alpha crystallin family protein n=1 Tax=Halovalidus salilacus TaxID=3075124 RepID=UPI00361119E2